MSPEDTPIPTDFDRIQSIPDERFIELFAQHQDPTNSLRLRAKARVLKHARGAFNLCVIVASGNLSCAIRVPGNGTRELWDSYSAWKLRGQAATLTYVRRLTSIPVPKVIAWDDTPNNVISAPYTLTTVVPGKEAWKVWFEVFDSRGAPVTAAADTPSPELERRRQRILRSLANYAAQMTRLTSDEIGYLCWDSNRGRSAVRLSPEASAVTTSELFWRITQHNAENPGQRSSRCNEFYARGLQILKDYITNSVPFARSTDVPGASKESFVLKHEDLHLQNILVDDDGNITGIIDWDISRFLPRCIGPVSVPLFLQEVGTMRDEASLSRHAKDCYRRCYFQYIHHEFGAEMGPRGRLVVRGDGQYTRKSWLYDVVYHLMHTTPQYTGEILEILFAMISKNPYFRGADKKYITLLNGLGECSDGEMAARLQKVLQDVLAP